MNELHSKDFSAGAIAPRLLLVVGSDAAATSTSSGRVRLGGNSDIYKLLPKEIAFQQLNLNKQLAASKQLLKRVGSLDLSPYECVWNLVTDPDQHPRTLETMGKLLRNHKGRIVNRPEAVLRSTRDQVAKLLSGIAGLHVPKVLRLRNPKPGAASKAVERAGLPYPLIVRTAGSHGGMIVGIAKRPDQLDSQCVGRADFILTEFVSFRSEDGLYRKYRVFIFGEHLVVRHMLVGEGWNVHARQRTEFMAERQHLLEEEEALIATGMEGFPEGVRKALQDVAKTMPLDCFGMDFGIGRGGQAVLFEANATMNFFPFLDEPRFDYVRKCLEPARQSLLRSLGFERGTAESSIATR